MSDQPSNREQYLAARKTAKGTLKVYLGAAPGVGKTYAMLQEAHGMLAQNVRVLAAAIETHGRADTVRISQDIPKATPRHVTYHGHTYQEIDVDGIIHENPDVVLVDELAHSVVTETGPVRKRWEDVHRLQQAGIDVISTVNIQHLESLSDVVYEITGVRQRETIPDHVLRQADEIELVDLSPAALRVRLHRGQIYQPDKVDTALAKYFRLGNLTALRELALLWMADQVDAGLEAYRQQENITEAWPTRERVMVAVTGGPESAALIRRGTRIVGRAAGRELMVVHVISQDGRTASESDTHTLAELKTLSESFGGTWHTLTGDNPAETLLNFARSSNAAQLVIGTSRSPWYLRILGPGVAGRIIAGANDIDVHIVANQTHTSRLPFNRNTQSALTRSRTIIGWVLAVTLPLGLTALFNALEDHDRLLSVNILSFLAAEVAVALIGGWWPALFTALFGSLLLNFSFIQPIGTLTIAAPENIASLTIFVLVAAGVARVVDAAARNTAEARAANSHALLMSELAGSVVREGTNIPALLNTIVETYQIPFATLQERDAEGTWTDQYTAGDIDPGAETEVFQVDDESRLTIAARPSSASEHQLLDAYAGRVLTLARQRQLRQARIEAQRLQAANSVRTTLLTAVSHDLRTPLASIKTAVSGMRMTDVELPRDLQQELLKNIEDSADRLDHIVTDLLQMSRIHTETLTVNMRSIDVAAIVDSTLTNMEPDTIPADLQITIPDGLPPVTSDPGLVERILANLLHNAQKHSMAPVRLDAAWIPADDSVEVRVADKGRGLSDEAKAAMFTPFSHMADSGPGGVGLGAAVAKGLADALGARLHPEDTPGGGLTMVLTLPLNPAAQQQTQPQADPTHEDQQEPSETEPSETHHRGPKQEEK